MMILKRYIHREIVEKLGWITALLLLIVASNRFVRYLADAAAGELPADLILQMLLMKMLAALPKLMPAAIFLAVILGLARLARDKELTVVSVSGVSHRFQFMSVFQLSVLFALLVFAMSFFISPWAIRGAEALKARAQAQADVTGMKAGKFKESDQGDRVIYIEKLSDENNHMENVFLQVREDNHLGVLRSHSARYEIARRSGSKYILFENGRRYVGYPGELDYQITQYRTYGVLVEEGGEGAGHVKLEALPSPVLLNSKNPQHKAELQWRLSFVMASLLLPLLAVALSGYAFNEQKYLPILMAIMIYIIYINLLGVSKTLLKRDVISASVGLWWVHLILVLLILAVFQFPALKRRLRHSNQHRGPPAER